MANQPRPNGHGDPLAVALGFDNHWPVGNAATDSQGRGHAPQTTGGQRHNHAATIGGQGQPTPVHAATDSRQRTSGRDVAAMATSRVLAMARSGQAQTIRGHAATVLGHMANLARQSPHGAAKLAAKMSTWWGGQKDKVGAVIIVAMALAGVVAILVALPLAGQLVVAVVAVATLGWYGRPVANNRQDTAKRGQPVVAVPAPSWPGVATAGHGQPHGHATNDGHVATDTDDEWPTDDGHSEDTATWPQDTDAIPELVTVDSVATAMRTAPDSVLILGQTVGGQIVTVDLDTEAPHVAISCGTGAGKSVLVQGIIAQALQAGCDVYISDPKRVSQKWARDLPGVRAYARTGQEIHDLFLRLGDELETRYEAIERGGTGGRRMLVILEEMNLAIRAIREHWLDNKPAGGPTRSPALAALGKLLFAGRAARMHVVSVSQMMTAAAAGGGELREQYGVRVLARASASAWRMLADRPVPPTAAGETEPGLMHVVIGGGSAVPIRVPFWSDAKALEWAAPDRIDAPAVVRDSLVVMRPGEPGIWTATLMERLTSTFPERYSRITPDALKDALLRAGIQPCQIAMPDPGTGERTNRRGFRRADLEAAAGSGL